MLEVSESAGSSHLTVDPNSVEVLQHNALRMFLSSAALSV